MKYSIKIVFGKEQVNKLISGIPLSQEEHSINVKEYIFDTLIELNAFVNGTKEAIGWMECYTDEPVSMLEG